MGPPDYSSIHQYVVEALPSDALEKAKEVFQMGKARVEKLELFAREALAATGVTTATKAKKTGVAKKAAKKPARSRKRPASTKSTLTAARKRKARKA
jgi:hypothetical protein